MCLFVVMVVEVVGNYCVCGKRRVVNIELIGGSYKLVGIINE